MVIAGSPQKQFMTLHLLSSFVTPFPQQLQMISV